MNIQMGETLTVSFDIDAHEYNGRWFNDISAWKVERNAVTPGSVPPLDIPQSTAMPQKTNPCQMRLIKLMISRFN